ncbi:MAG: S26 family signal peptidase [Candidatus Baldrarchaeia archaeon]
MKAENIILLALVGIIAYGIWFRQPVVNVNVPSPKVRVDVPQPKVVIEDNPQMFDLFGELVDVVRSGICDVNCECEPIYVWRRNNNIQPAHTDVQWTLRGGDLIVKNIVAVSDTFGYSMQPTIFSGNKLILQDYYSKSQLKEGMIIYYVSNGKNRVHRIKGLYEDFLVVQGDNTDTEEKINYKQIKYIVVGVLYD